MMKKIILSIICVISITLSYAQDSTKVYFLDKLSSQSLPDNLAQLNSKLKLSASAKIYQVQKGHKIDSLHVPTHTLKIWKDSLAFEVLVPNRFLSKGSKLALKPVYIITHRLVKGTGGEILTLGNEIEVAQIKLKIKSEPTGAVVYLVPKFYWEIQPELKKLDWHALQQYQVAQGLTTVNIYVQEYVYEVVFKLDGNVSRVEITPNHLHQIDSVFTKFK